MANVRGVDLLDARAFLRDTYGPDSHQKVMEALDAEARATFEPGIRETGWYPIAALQSYLAAGRRVLDPAALEFFRRQGRYAADRRKRGPLMAMVASPALRMRLAGLVWRMFYDVGRLEVVGSSPETALGRIYDFPATPELCERFVGIWEGMAGSRERPGRAAERRCVLHGDPYCEFEVLHDGGTPSSGSGRPG
jgi:hypothetical protein